MVHNVDPQLSQWDVGRSVKVSDTKATHIHFANQGDSKAVIIDIINGEAKIPDYLLQTGKAIIAYLVLDGVTLESKSFPVRKRERPENYVYEDDQRNYIYELITNAERVIEEASTAVDEASTAADNANQIAQELRTAKENGEFNGPKGDPGSVKYVVVNELPQEDTENAIYLVPVTDGAESNLFDEYIYVDGAWEKIGSSTVAVDLTDYVKKTDYPDSTIKAGVVKVNPTDFGIGAYPTTGILYVTPADKAQIDAKTHVRRPITPHLLDYAVKKGLTDNKEEWTDDEKASARALVGAVGSTDYGSNEKPGLVQGYTPYGIYANPNTGIISIVGASYEEIDAKSNGYRPITPKNLDYAVKSALTTNTITLTDEEKAAVRAWLGID